MTRMYFNVLWSRLIIRQLGIICFSTTKTKFLIRISWISFLEVCGISSFFVFLHYNQHFNVGSTLRFSVDPTLKMKQYPTSDFQRCTAMIQRWCSASRCFKTTLHNVDATLFVNRRQSFILLNLFHNIFTIQLVIKF